MNPGDTINQYMITRLLGEGGGGRVHVAIDTFLQREVAIKTLRPELLSDAQFTERFVAEAKNLAALNHPNITTLYALQRHDDHLLMVMELVRGRTVESILEERGGAVPVREALAIVAQAADGLAFAHEAGVVHRDIKPSNLMVSETGRVKIMDFGIARASGADRLTRAGSIIGTPMYMSPEQCKGAPGDQRSDLYSLAIVLYELLSGAPPFAGGTDYELIEAQIKAIPPVLIPRVAGVTAALESAIFKALAKKPEQRFQSVREFRDAIGGPALLADATAIMAAFESSGGSTATHEIAGRTSVTGRISTVAQSRVGAAGRRFRAWSPLAQGAAAAMGALLVAAMGYGAFAMLEDTQPATLALTATMSNAGAPPTMARTSAPPEASTPPPAQAAHPPTSVAQTRPAPALPDPGCPGGPNCGPRTDNGGAQQPAKAVQTLPPPAPPQVVKSIETASLSPAEQAPTRPVEIVGTPQVIDTATLIVTGRRVELEGVVGVGGKLADTLADFIREMGGQVACAPRGSKYRCYAGEQRADLSKAVLVNGAGRASVDASADLLEQEREARAAMRGLWAAARPNGHKTRKTP